MAHPLTAWRAAHEVSKGKLARRIGVNWRRLHRIERGEAACTLELGIAIERETQNAVTQEMLLDAFRALRAQTAA
jgi:DNA-binding XRE family transcriptional regulator